MVGSLYPKQEKSKLDSAFTIFYMGINLGAFLGQLICPIIGDVKHNGIRDIHAFKWGFLAAGNAMLIGTAVFYFLKGIGFSNALFSPRTPPGTPPAELSDTHPRGCWARHQPVEH